MFCDERQRYRELLGMIGSIDGKADAKNNGIGC
jgi:hypothetical protein